MPCEPNSNRFGEIFAPKRLNMASIMDEAHYWYVQIGSIMLIVGILTGSIWAASSWGRFSSTRLASMS